MRTKEQTKLIKEAATIDADGWAWRNRLDRWLDTVGPTKPSKWLVLVNSGGCARWIWSFTSKRWEFCG